MLDPMDVASVEIVYHQITICAGFHCLIGPRDLLSLAGDELNRRLESDGRSSGAVINLSAFTADEIEQLTMNSPLLFYISGLPNDDGLKQINRARDIFIKSGANVILLVTPLEWKRLSHNAPAIWNHLTGKCQPLGAQRILDSMGDDLKGRVETVLNRIDEYELKLDSILKSRSATRPDCFVVLRRWNSFSPILVRRPSMSIKEAEEGLWNRMRRLIRGGGYLIRWRNKGIVIDPGHNYLENLYETGFSIDDLDIIVISHDHLDHTADFEPIVDLLYQSNKRGNPKRLSIYLNQTTFEKYGKVLDKNPYTTVNKLDQNKGYYRIICEGVRLYVKRAKHKEIGGTENALSLKLHLFPETGGKRTSIGFTSDTGWHADLVDFFKDVTLLVPHLGSVRRYELEDARFYESHLGILGLFRLLEQLEQVGCSPTVVISEFGEELMGLRDILANELGARFREMKILPGDIGHTVVFSAGRNRIICCRAGSCDETAVHYLEQEGLIHLLCNDHSPTLGVIGYGNPGL